MSARTWRRTVGAAYEWCAAPLGRRALAGMLDAGLPSRLVTPLRYLFTGELSPAQRDVQTRVESRRAAIFATTTPFDLAEWRPPGLHLPVSGASEATGQWLAHIASVPPRWGMFLHLCADAWPGRMVELGSCVGISTAYLAASSGCRELLAIEGAPPLARTAQQSLEAVGGRGTVFNGRFDDRLPEVVAASLADGGVSLAYVDGDHTEAATLRYVKALLPALAPDAMVVLDDIYFSSEMWKAWCALRAQTGVAAAVDTGRFGLLIRSGDGGGPTHYDLSQYTGWWRVRSVTPS